MCNWFHCLVSCSDYCPSSRSCTNRVTWYFWAWKEVHCFQIAVLPAIYSCRKRGSSCQWYWANSGTLRTSGALIRSSLGEGNLGGSLQIWIRSLGWRNPWRALDGQSWAPWLIWARSIHCLTQWMPGSPCHWPLSILLVLSLGYSSMWPSRYKIGKARPTSLEGSQSRCPRVWPWFL